MNSKNLVNYTPHFSKKAKRLLKKFPSLPDDLDKLELQLLNEPRTGTALGNDTYKIRLAIKSKGKGKSGGARVISYIETEIIGIVQNNVVNLLTIYDKSEVNSISQEQIDFLIRNLDR